MPQMHLEGSAKNCFGALQHRPYEVLLSLLLLLAREKLQQHPRPSAQRSVNPCVPEACEYKKYGVHETKQITNSSTTTENTLSRSSFATNCSTPTTSRLMASRDMR